MLLTVAATWPLTCTWQLICLLSKLLFTCEHYFAHTGKAVTKFHVTNFTYPANNYKPRDCKSIFEQIKQVNPAYIVCFPLCLHAVQYCRQSLKFFSTATIISVSPGIQPGTSFHPTFMIPPSVWTVSVEDSKRNNL